MNPTVESAWIAAAATLVGVGGAVTVAIAAARYTRRTNQATLDAAHADAQLTLDAAREAQFADRYSRALDQVGSSNLDVRIGGIFALEGIALDSPRHHPTVMEVLTAFVRGHSPAPVDGPKLTRRALPDVEAALAVVGRRKVEHDIRAMDLTHAVLAGADLTRTRLARAVLFFADLSGAVLTDAVLAAAELTGADLSRANLTGADLTRADLSNANLIRADLSRANLDNARLDNARLDNARLDNPLVLRASPTPTSPASSSPTPISPTRTSPGRTSPGRTSPTHSSSARTSPARIPPTRSSPARTSPARSGQRIGRFQTNGS